MLTIVKEHTLVINNANNDANNVINNAKMLHNNDGYSTNSVI